MKAVVIFLFLSQGVVTSALNPSEYLEAHNEIRRGVNPSAANMKKLKWSPELASIAQKWAATCPSRHNDNRSLGSSFSYVGENMYSGTGHASASSVVGAWADESNFYNYQQNSCSSWSPGCGHYTQVVWADTEYVGCGESQDCNGWTHIVCNYGVGGNFNGLRPYVSGNTCSQCPSGYTCENGLCKN